MGIKLNWYRFTDTCKNIFNVPYLLNIMFPVNYLFLIKKQCDTCTVCSRKTIILFSSYL